MLMNFVMTWYHSLHDRRGHGGDYARTGVLLTLKSYQACSGEIMCFAYGMATVVQAR